MKITDNSPVGKAGSIKKKQKAATADGAFGEMLDSSGMSEGAAVSAPIAPAGIGGLLAVPPVMANESPNEQQRQRGHALLDELEQLRLDLLEGRVSPERAKVITERLKHDRQATADPELHDIIDAVELRCEVELAKLEKMGG